MSLLLCFSGEIGSGKSSVSAAVAEALGWRRTGFGDYLRGEIAQSGGDPNDRQALQDLGQARVDQDALKFCRDVLAGGGFQAGDNFVIDGIRHVSIFEHLAQVSVPSEAKLLFLSAGEATRSSRVQMRSDAGDFERASRHRVEADLREALPDRADALIEADNALERVVADCLNYVGTWAATAIVRN
jgi:cytidylate kinase